MTSECTDATEDVLVTGVLVGSCLNVNPHYFQMCRPTSVASAVEQLQRDAALNAVVLFVSIDILEKTQRFHKRVCFEEDTTNVGLDCVSCPRFAAQKILEELLAWRDAIFFLLLFSPTSCQLKEAHNPDSSDTGHVCDDSEPVRFSFFFCKTEQCRHNQVRWPFDWLPARPMLS